MKNALSLLSQFSVEDPNIESLREGWQQVVGAIATQNKDTALSLLTKEIWADFVCLGIAETPIDSPQKFISKYASEQQIKKSAKSQSQTASKKRK